MLIWALLLSIFTTSPVSSWRGAWMSGRPQVPGPCTSGTSAFLHLEPMPCSSFLFANTGMITLLWNATHETQAFLLLSTSFKPQMDTCVLHFSLWCFFFHQPVCLQVFQPGTYRRDEARCGNPPRWRGSVFRWRGCCPQTGAYFVLTILAACACKLPEWQRQGKCSKASFSLSGPWDMSPCTGRV